MYYGNNIQNHSSQGWLLHLYVGVTYNRKIYYIETDKLVKESRLPPISSP